MEYPKQLYGSGWKNLNDTVVVNDAKEEAKARKKGYIMLTELDAAADTSADKIAAQEPTQQEEGSGRPAWLDDEGSGA